MPDPREVRRIAALADTHLTTQSESLRPLLDQVAESADVLLLCGDLTDRGRPEEAEALARQLAVSRTRILAVLGNHDYESGAVPELKRILSDVGVTILDGESCTIGGVGFVGVKGFGGGFGRRALTAWGEPATKGFVQEAINETMMLEAALVRVDAPHRIVMLHYAPIDGTVEGEPCEIYPFLGSSHLEGPINRHAVSAVFHGHAHHGRPEGKTQTGIPVYNVSRGVLQTAFPDQPTFRVYQVEHEPQSAG